MKKWYLITFIILLVITGCSKQNDQITEKGILKGKISIGPICPVERIPPDPRCQPTQETYKAWPIAVWDNDGFGSSNPIAKISPNLNGTYELELPEGGYFVALEKPPLKPPFPPTRIIIKPGEITNLDINLDTGIR